MVDYYVDDNSMDAALNDIANNGNKMFVCSAYPTTYQQASSTYKLASEDLVTGDGNGDYAIADGTREGRKLTVAAQASIAVLATGKATHVAICDSANSRIKRVSPLTTSVDIVAGNTVTIPAITHTLPDAGPETIKYWGQLATAPTSGMITNDEYYDTTLNGLYVYSGSAWTAVEGA